MTFQDVLLLAAVFVTAMLYSSVGHGGASGYLAVMSLLRAPPALMRPTALLLNVIVSGIATIRFAQSGNFSFRRVWPFLLGSIPAAWYGGTLHLSDANYRRLLGVALLIATLRMLLPARGGGRSSRPPILFAVVCGAVIGAVSGLVGIGGGVFLSPILLLGGWANVRQAAAVSAPFILVNSAAGLSGGIEQIGGLPQMTWAMAVAALAGGLLGSELGAKRIPLEALRLVLAVVLAIAGVHLLLR